MIERERRIMNTDAMKTPEDHVIENELLQEFSKAVDALNNKFREVFLLRYWAAIAI